MSTYYYKYSHDFFSVRDNVYFRYYNPRVDIFDDRLMVNASVDIAHISSIYPTTFPDYSTNDVYPMAVRYADPINNIYVVERPPFEIDVDFSTNKSFRSRKVPKVFLSNKMYIPWTVSFIKFSKSFSDNSYSYEFYLYFNNKPISSMDDILIPAWLPNVSSNGQVCMGEDSRLVVSLLADSSQSSFLEIYNTIFNNFFSGWNSDLLPFFCDTDFSLQFREKLIDTFPKVRWPNTFSQRKTYWPGNNNAYIKNILLMVSHMDYPQMSQYIDSVLSRVQNEPSPIYKYSIKPLRNIITSLTPNKIRNSEQSFLDYDNKPSLYNTADYNKTFRSFFPHVKNFSIRFLITDIPYQELLPDNIVASPALLAKIYEESLNIINGTPTTPISYITGSRIEIPYSDLFSNQLNLQEVSNV
jgi:hypothetical protein